MRPVDVAATMLTLDVWWAVAGGWAIDLWLDRETREHHDIEVVVPRSDQWRVLEALTDRWDVFCLDPPGTGWRAWPGHALERPAFQLQARGDTGEFDLFLEDVADGVWHYRRTAAIRRSVDGVVVVSRSGIPVVRPEIQLLYMATSADPKNLSDFEHAVPALGAEPRRWLRDALRFAHQGHAWIDRL